MTHQPLLNRRVAFAFDDDYVAAWTPDRPEFACVANGVSLLMPHLEPVVAAAVNNPQNRSARTIAFARQETQHLHQHRALNRLLLEQHPIARRLDRTMAEAFRWIGRRSLGFRLGFAVGSETIAYHSARWTEKRRRTLFANAEPVAATLFLWHFAEEVEHKSDAHDAAVASGATWRTLTAGKLMALVTMAGFITAATLLMLGSSRRLWRPICHLRMAWWSISFAFELLPQFAIALLPGHDPDLLADPLWYETWLAQYDPVDGTLPLWNSELDATGRPADVVAVR